MSKGWRFKGKRTKGPNWSKLMEEYHLTPAQREQKRQEEQERILERNLQRALRQTGETREEFEEGVRELERLRSFRGRR